MKVKFTVTFLCLILTAWSEASSGDIRQILDQALKKSSLYVHNGMGGCSASFIWFESMTEEQNALVLTNGHCIGFGSFAYGSNRYPAAGETYKNRANQTRFETYDGRFFQAKRLLAATMTDLDVAIYELEQSYKQIRSYGYEILPVAKNKAIEPRTHVGFSSAYWRNIWDCEIEDTNLTLKEGPWRWKTAIGLVGRNCMAKPGASGSPLIDLDYQVIGTLNTAHTGGQHCTLMNPCEVSKDNRFIGVPGKAYAMSIVELNSCVENGVFNAASENCPIK